MSFAQYIFQGILFFWLFSHTLVLSSILPHHRGHNLESLQRKALQGSWYQPVDHPVRALFGRHGRFPEDDSTYPAVGSPGKTILSLSFNEL